jgi:DNA polymerase III sliding clamp (beta) subunit (PCNA family)
LSHIWFNEQHAFAYDGGLGIRVPLDTELNCGVPGAATLALLKTSSLKQVALEPDEAFLTVKLGRSRSKLASLDLEREVWPFSMKSIAEDDAFVVSEEFIEALRSVLMVKASSATRIEHHGVLVYFDKKQIDLYTTDSSTIARATVDNSNSLVGEMILLPRPFAEQLVAQCLGGADLWVLSDCLVARADGIELYSNVLDISEIQDIRKVVAKAQKSHPTDIPLPAGLEAALDRALIIAGGDEASVEFVIEGDELSLSGGGDFGEVSERLKLEEPHPEVELSLTVALLRRALKLTDTFSAVDESIAFYGGDAFLYLVAART